MEAIELILFLKVRLKDNYVTSKVEIMNIPVMSKDMCVILKKKVVTCNVNDEAMALTALWRFATEEIPCLFVSTRRNTPTLLKDMFEEVFGLSIDDIDLRKSSSLAGFGSFLDDFSKMKIYINDSTKSIDDKCIKDMIAVYDIKLIVTDIMDVQ